MSGWWFGGTGVALKVVELSPRRMVHGATFVTRVVCGMCLPASGRCRRYTSDVQRHCHMEEAERSLKRGMSTLSARDRCCSEVERRYIRFCLLSLSPVCEPNSRWIAVFDY